MENGMDRWRFGAFNSMTDLLQYHFAEGNIVGVFSDPSDDSRFSVGWLADVSADCYALKTIDEHGKPEGLQIGLICNVFECVSDSSYLNKLNSLYRGMEFSFADSDMEIKASVHDFLVQCTGKPIAVTLVTSTSSEINGYVVHVTKEIIVIRELTHQLEYGGFAVLTMDRVRRVEALGQKQERLGDIMRSILAFEDLVE